jgi:hypothetical protein
MSLKGRVEERDRGLRRVSRLTRWTLSGGLVLSGGFAAVAAQAYAGHARSTPQTGASGLSAPSTPTGESDDGSAAVAPLQSPGASPQQTVPQYSYPAPVVSGGS